MLDIGCGTGLISYEIQKRSGIAVHGIDVLPNRDSPIRITVYDGNTLPFRDASFDQVLLCFILHHSADPIAVLKEAIRVSKKRLIIVEDIAENRVAFLFAKAHDWFVNKITVPDMELPYHFKSTAEWVNAFHTEGLTIVREYSASSLPFQPIKQTLFLLEK